VKKNHLTLLSALNYVRATDSLCSGSETRNIL